jgi:hypothetical protein
MYAHSGITNCVILPPSVKPSNPMPWKQMSPTPDSAMGLSAALPLATRCNGEGRVSQGTRQRGRCGCKTREETEVRLQEKTFYLPETESDRIQDYAYLLSRL